MLPHEKPTRLVPESNALAGGAAQALVARECGVTERTLRRHLAAPGSALLALVEQEKARLASAVQDESKDLLDKAMAVIATHLDGSGKLSLDAARTVLTKLLPDKAVVKVEEEPAPEVTAEEACREVSLSLPALADLARTGQLSAEVIQSLRSSCAGFLADDLLPRPPIDTEADRVELLVDEVEGRPAEPSMPNAGAVRH